MDPIPLTRIGAGGMHEVTDGSILIISETTLPAVLRYNITNYEYLISWSGVLQSADIPFHV